MKVHALRIKTRKQDFLAKDQFSGNIIKKFHFDLILGHRCTHDTVENCRNDILVTGLKRYF